MEVTRDEPSDSASRIGDGASVQAVTRVNAEHASKTISRTLSTNSGSFDNLNVWLRCGCKPNAAHIRRIVVWEKPVSPAIERIDQCVASTGVVRNVRSITAAT